MFVLKLFGGLSIESDHDVLSGPAAQRHRLALLALLAVHHPCALSRDKAIAYLWPERDAERARNVLNQSVHALRRALGEKAILSAGDDLRFNPDLVGCDVAAFEGTIAAGSLERASGLYGGAFLDGFFLSHAPEFERWVGATRERLENIHLDIQVNGSQIRIEANKRDDSWDRHNDNVVETDFEIEVPQDASLDVNAFSSEVRISNVHGRQKVHTFSGAVDLRDAVGPIDAETFSGDIDVDLAPNASGRVDFDTFSGDLTSAIPIAYKSGNRRGARGEIGSGGTNTLRFHTFSGDVHIK